MIRYFTFFTSLLLSTTLSANTLVLPSETAEELKASIQSSWMHCEEHQWCIDELFYYRESFIAEANITNRKFTIELLAEYTPHLLSQLQLHLRQDGFRLIKADIEGVEFNVESAIKEASVAEADKALILFLNRYPSAATRKLSWQTHRWDARLYSDGELVSLTFILRGAASGRD